MSQDTANRTFSVHFLYTTHDFIHVQPLLPFPAWEVQVFLAVPRAEAIP